METDLESAAWKGEPTGNTTPLWIWLVVLGLGAIAIYASYEALDRNQLYQEAERARAALARDKDRLQANANDVNRQLDEANKRTEATEAALKQSRADTGAASGQINDLQGQVTKLQGQVTDLQGKAATAEGASASADAKAKQATVALQAEVDSLKAELAETQKKLTAALADLAHAQQSPRPPATTPSP